MCRNAGIRIHFRVYRPQLCYYCWCTRSQLDQCADRLGSCGLSSWHIVIYEYKGVSKELSITKYAGTEATLEERGNQCLHCVINALESIVYTDCQTLFIHSQAQWGNRSLLLVISIGHRLWPTFMNKRNRNFTGMLMGLWEVRSVQRGKCYICKQRRVCMVDHSCQSLPREWKQQGGRWCHFNTSGRRGIICAGLLKKILWRISIWVLG